jgi:hypothetical protein
MWLSASSRWCQQLHHVHLCGAAVARELFDGIAGARVLGHMCQELIDDVPQPVRLLLLPLILSAGNSQPVRRYYLPLCHHPD